MSIHIVGLAAAQSQTAHAFPYHIWRPSFGLQT